MNKNGVMSDQATRIEVLSWFGHMEIMDDEGFAKMPWNTKMRKI